MLVVEFDVQADGGDADDVLARLGELQRHLDPVGGYKQHAVLDSSAHGSPPSAPPSPPRSSASGDEKCRQLDFMGEAEREPPGPPPVHLRVLLKFEVEGHGAADAVDRLCAATLPLRLASARVLQAERRRLAARCLFAVAITSPEEEEAGRIQGWLLTATARGEARLENEVAEIAGLPLLAAAEMRQTVVVKFDLAALPAAGLPPWMAGGAADGASTQAARPPPLVLAQAVGRGWLCRRWLGWARPGAAALLADSRTNLLRGRPPVARSFGEAGKLVADWRRPSDPPALVAARRALGRLPLSELARRAREIGVLGGAGATKTAEAALDERQPREALVDLLLLRLGPLGLDGQAEQAEQAPAPATKPEPEPLEDQDALAAFKRLQRVVRGGWRAAAPVSLAGAEAVVAALDQGRTGETACGCPAATTSANRSHLHGPTFRRGAAPGSRSGWAESAGGADGSTGGRAGGSAVGIAPREGCDDNRGMVSRWGRPAAGRLGASADL